MAPIGKAKVRVVENRRVRALNPQRYKDTTPVSVTTSVAIESEPEFTGPASIILTPLPSPIPAPISETPIPSKETVSVTKKSNVWVVGEALMRLAGMCDGAQSWDGCGFNKFDSGFGKSIAMSFNYTGTLTEKQFQAGQHLANKYRRQLGVANDYFKTLEYDGEKMITPKSDTAEGAAPVAPKESAKDMVIYSGVMYGRLPASYLIKVGEKKFCVPVSISEIISEVKVGLDINVKFKVPRWYANKYFIAK